MDFTQSFRKLSELIKNRENKYFKKHKNISKFNSWSSKWSKRLSKENLKLSEISFQMNKINPVYIPRNHLVEKAIENAVF